MPITRPITPQLFRELNPCDEPSPVDPEWTELITVDFSGLAGGALTNGESFSAGGITFTVRSQDISTQSWVREAKGINLTHISGTVTSAIHAPIDTEEVLGRVPDVYDMFALQALWTDVTMKASFTLLGVIMGKDAPSVIRGGLTRSLKASHMRFSGNRWLARVSNADGFVQTEVAEETDFDDLDNEDMLIGGVFTENGDSVFGQLRQDALQDGPGNLRKCSIAALPAPDRGELERFGVFCISNNTGSGGTLVALRLQHMRIPGAPEP